MHIKKTRMIAVEEIHNFNVDNEDTEIIKDSAGSVINSETTSRKSREAETRRAALEELRDHQEQRCAMKDQTKITHTPSFQLLRTDEKAWTGERLTGENDAFEDSAGGKLYRFSGPAVGPRAT